MPDRRIDVSSVLSEHGASLEVTGRFDLRCLSVGGSDLELEAPAVFELSLVNAGEGLLVSGRVTATVAAECSRCLRGFDLELEGEVDGLFVQPGQEDGLPQEQDYQLLKGNIADVGPLLEAALAIEVPFSAIHDPACQGLCPQCGADLNEVDCECRSKPAPDHPFASLGELLEDGNGSGNGGNGSD